MSSLSHLVQWLHHFLVLWEPSLTVLRVRRNLLPMPACVTSFCYSKTTMRVYHRKCFPIHLQVINIYCDIWRRFCRPQFCVRHVASLLVGFIFSVYPYPSGLLWHWSHCNKTAVHVRYSISQEICTQFLICCALLWLYIDWFSHIHQAYFTGTVAI